jgi:predicted membrane channel-forming protein YqfA (hemolysin III family)
MDWILSREVMITMAVLGAIAAVLATLPRIRSVGLARSLNSAGYVLMGASMLVFIISGWRSG